MEPIGIMILIMVALIIVLILLLIIGIFLPKRKNKVEVRKPVSEDLKKIKKQIDG